MISREEYEAYTASLDQQYAEACRLLIDYIDSFDWNVDFETKKAQRNLVIEYAHALLDVYGANAATIAAEFYLDQATEAGVDVRMPEIAHVATPKQVAAAIRYAARHLWGGTVDVESFREQCVASLRRYIKKAAQDTVMAAARRDGKAGRGLRWARVPRGDETCPFCMMLASRGFVYHSEESEELFGHEHEHCDCDVICSFSDGGLEGYSYQKYLDGYEDHVVYDEYGHVDTNATINSWRRDVYDKNKKRWNEMRRERYAREHPKE